MRAYFDDSVGFPIQPESEQDKRTTFETELRNLINYYSVENQSNTPDFILANYLINCLDNFSITMTQRDNWYNFKPFENKLNN